MGPSATECPEGGFALISPRSRRGVQCCSLSASALQTTVLALEKSRKGARNICREAAPLFLSALSKSIYGGCHYEDIKQTVEAPTSYSYHLPRKLLFEQAG